MQHTPVHPALRSFPRRWLYALKPASWPKLLVPATLGQVCGALAGAPSWTAALVGVGFTIFLLIYIALLNDYGDIEVDALKRRMFPRGCSPKTIPDGILYPQSVGLAGVGAGLCAAAVALCGELALDRPGLSLMGIFCLSLLTLYTFRPLRLNYRGGGEFLEMLGVGVALPAFNAHAHGGALSTSLLAILPGLAILALASAIASGLADEQTDRLGGKVTYVTEYGNHAARSAVENLVLGAVVLWVMAARLADALPALGVTPAVAVVLIYWRKLSLVSPRARVGEFSAISEYKRHLHRGTWLGTLALALALALNSWLLEHAL
ncbi:MAG: prenyltransferase [Nannocystaceae bacterium]|nr:prenyltransferase [Myxococcales bacterium]